MTKKFLCILLSLICAIQVFSQEVDEKIAQIVAENFFYNTFKGGYRVKDSIHFVDVDNLQIQSINTKSVNGLNKYHIINFKEGGWVIVSGNKGVGPIFMYSEQGHLGQDESFPDVFKEWLFLFEESVDSANKTNFIPKEKQEKWYNFENNIFKTDSNEGNKLKRSDFSDGSAFYLLDSKWGQSEANGYDSSVPAYNISMDSGGCYNPTTNNTGNYLAGCTAVAMGQILRYWEFSYGPYAEYDWWFMSDALYTNSSNFTRNRLAISSMLKNIGERVDASYGCGGTSTINTISKAKTAFKALGYVEDDMDHKYKSLHSYSGWVSLLREEVEANRPILYTTQTHSLVCDGYNYENGDLHFNLGWNNYNVFVDFEDLPVSGGVIYHECLIGINPNWITHLAVQNNTVISEYLTGDPLSITYQAKKITLAGNNSTFTIMPEANLRLLASDTITLLPGFWAKSGSSMLAKHFANTEGTLKSENISNTSFLSDNEDSKYVILSPNPSYDGPFYINAINDKKDSESIGSVYSIINSQGTILYEGRVFQDILDIDLGNYPKGIYYLKLTINNNVVTYKLLSL